MAQVTPQQPNHGYHNPPPKKSGMSTGGIIAIVLGVLFLIAMMIVGLLVLMLYPAVAQVRNAARRTASMNNGRQIALAMHNFSDAQRRLPSNRRNDEGIEIQSWRVELLPFLEQMNVSDAIDPALPWDAPANQPYTDMAIPTYQSLRGENMNGSITHFVAVDDPLSPMSPPAGEKMTLESISNRDGTSNTAILLEFPASDINWGEPRDVTISEAINIIQNPSDPAGTVVVLADGSSITVAPGVSTEDITKLFLLDNGAAEGVW